MFAALVPLHADAKAKVSRDGFKKVKDREKAKESHGFLVVGFSAAHLERAKGDRLRDIEIFQGLSEASRKEMGMKEPKPWNEAEYMDKAKPKRVRSRPYEMAVAADECAALATMAGWQRVSVQEILKG